MLWNRKFPLAQQQWIPFDQGMTKADDWVERVLQCCGRVGNVLERTRRIIIIIDASLALEDGDCCNFNSSDPLLSGPFNPFFRQGNAPFLKSF
jgi:hypothetical protein